MYSFSGSPSGADSVRPVKGSGIEIDPLALYESQSTGREFEAYVPEARGRRDFEMRRDETILKNWRASSSSAGDDACRIEGRERLSSMRNLESRHSVNGERLFLVVLTFMILTLGSLLAFFVSKFHF